MELDGFGWGGRFQQKAYWTNMDQTSAWIQPEDWRLLEKSKVLKKNTYIQKERERASDVRIRGGEAVSWRINRPWNRTTEQRRSIITGFVLAIIKRRV